MSHLKLVVNNTEKNKKKSQKRNSSQSVLDCDPFSELNLAYYDKDYKRLINMQPETSGLLVLEKLNAPVQLYQIHDILEGTLNQICINDLQREFAGENRTYCPFFTEFKVGLFFKLIEAYEIATIKKPCPTKKRIKWGSGKLLGISGVSNAFSPPPIPQKKETSKNNLFFVNKKIPIKRVDKLHICIGINSIHAKFIE